MTSLYDPSTAPVVRPGRSRRPDVPREVMGAADTVLASLGGAGAEAAPILLAALRAGWLTRHEAELLAPFAQAFAYLAELELPPHRGRP